uniref:Fe2OG dioxygenase domain-containing protein n=1 Tax=Tetraselmis sp. GSL018 TaxID=582737 RepID=A0A061R336_9CHLO
MELVPEFTSLIEWGPGSSIGWHHDANRPYLRRRDYTAVLYLNSAGADFGGGSLSFRAGEPREVEPRAGTVVAYGTGPGDEHRVEPVLWGHRSTLTMWFSLDGAAAEDAAVLRALNDPRRQGLPEEMYLREDGADVRAERVERLGFELRRADAAGRGATSDAAPSEVWLIRDRTSSGDATEARGIARAAMIAHYHRLLHASSAASSGAARVPAAVSCFPGPIRRPRCLPPGCRSLTTTDYSTRQARPPRGQPGAAWPGGSGNRRQAPFLGRRTRRRRVPATRTRSPGWRCSAP